MRRPGVEILFLKAMPSLVLAGVVPGTASVLALEGTARFVALGFVVAWLLLLVPAAFGCLIIAAMKGPVRHGRDPYPGMPD